MKTRIFHVAVVALALLMASSQAKAYMMDITWTGADSFESATMTFEPITVSLGLIKFVELIDADAIFHDFGAKNAKFVLEARLDGAFQTVGTVQGDFGCDSGADASLCGISNLLTWPISFSSGTFDAIRFRVTGGVKGDAFMNMAGLKIRVKMLEPDSLAILGIGLVALGFVRRRRSD